MSLDFGYCDNLGLFRRNFFPVFMKLEEFDVVIDRMKLAFETAKNLGHSIEQAKILYHMNEFLPQNMQVSLDDAEDENMAKQIVSLYKSQINLKISKFREQLMLN